MFFINREFEVNIFLEKLTFNKFIKKISILFKKLEYIYKKFKNNIEFLNIQIKKHADILRIRKLAL